MYQDYRGNFPVLSIMVGEAESLYLKEEEAKLLVKDRFNVLPESGLPLEVVI